MIERVGKVNGCGYMVVNICYYFMFFVVVIM